VAKSPGKPFRVIATGLRGGRANIAFDQALIEARRESRIPDTIRFLRFRPSALIGIHQFLSHEIKLDYCNAHGIETVRRITGGGGLYFDEGQIGWELVFDRATLGLTDLAEVTRRICEAAALGLQKLGVPAQYRPRNDIEVDGRKISGAGGFFDGNLIFYQGTLLIDFDPARMLACLNVPAEKLAKRGIDSAAQRVVTMREIMGDALPNLETIYERLVAGFAEGLGIAPQWGPITAYEEELAERAFREEIGTDAYVTMLDADRPRRHRTRRYSPGRAVPRSHPRSADHRRLLRHAAASRIRSRGIAARRQCRRRGPVDRKLLRPHHGRLSQLERRRLSPSGRDGAAPAQRDRGCKLKTPPHGALRLRFRKSYSNFGI